SHKVESMHVVVDSAASPRSSYRRSVPCGPVVPAIIDDGFGQGGHVAHRGFRTDMREPIGGRRWRHDSSLYTGSIARRETSCQPGGGGVSCPPARAGLRGGGPHG